MEKNINWHEITYEPNDVAVPCKRWGHKTVYVQDQILLFGGFSDVTYLNDLWAYNIHTNKWREIKTTGVKPEGKSNFTMHFDPVTNQLLIFGGGGPNKRRFNKINLLNWTTKEWSEVVYELNDGNPFALCCLDCDIPWQRTYHSSEFKYPFLITFGGEGPGNIDLDDLWVFNIETRKWAQIKTNPTKATETPDKTKKIEGRKFHSTTMIEDKFYVISGCKMNYACIPTIYSIDLKALYTKQNPQKETSNTSPTSEIAQPFKWQAHPISPQLTPLIEKWGHSSQPYNGKIYIFGGRNQQDYNDLIEFNPTTNHIHKLTPSIAQGKLPKSRRRHSSCMIGSSMLIFGGFNQDYFNDLQYISLFQCRDTLEKERYWKEEEGEEVIELDAGMFGHFMHQMDKDKQEYDIQLFIESPTNHPLLITKSITSHLRKHSPYFCHLLTYHPSSNPEHKTLTIPLSTLNVNPLSFQIFNNYLIKELLILPKNYKLKRLCELLVCADYFQVKRLFDLVENLLMVGVIDQTRCVDDVFNIAANWNMPKLLKVCAQKKISDRTYFNSFSRAISLTPSASRLKDRHIEQMLTQIQFDEIQKGQKRRTLSKHFSFGRNIKQLNLVAEEKGLVEIRNKRKKSFMEKVRESVNKFCAYGEDYGSGERRVVIGGKEKWEGFSGRAEEWVEDSDDEEEGGVVEGNQIKMF